MRKVLFKKILNIIDVIELHDITLQQVPIKIYEMLLEDKYDCKMEDIKAFVAFLVQKKMVKVAERMFDLIPSCTIYAKSNQNSGIEALSLMESFLYDKKIKQFFLHQIIKNDYVLLSEVVYYIDVKSMDLMQQSKLFEIDGEKLRIFPKLKQGAYNILQEYTQDTPIISMTLTALYTSIIVAHDDYHVEYKNMNLDMCSYPNQNVILTILPRRGIPHDRDETKALQAFYKDNLYHEFNHACPICGIDIPHMLVASHIKPFRNCAHIYEAVDHENGLLLCRNHDYLFDQGYISFDHDAHLLISDSLKKCNRYLTAFQLQEAYVLPELYRKTNRLQFLKYHQTHIFRK